MATSPTITNRILIRADALNSDSPKNALTSREISVKQRDDVDFAIALSNAGQKIPASEIARICVEIFDIGARNSPAPRAVKLLFSKSSEDISDISESCDCNATIPLAAEENAFEAGPKWMRVCAFSPEGRRTTFAQGWISSEESFGDAPAIGEEIPQSFLKTEDAKGLFLQKQNDLSDLIDKKSARENLGTLSESEIASAIGSACALKADASHSHSEYLEKTEAATLYAPAEATEGEIENLAAELSSLRLGGARAGRLHFDGGKLSAANWTSVVIPLPFSLAIEYEVESWDGISYEYDNEFSFFNCTNADWNVSGYPIYGFRLTKNGESTLGFTLGGCGGEGMGASRGWSGNITLPTGRHTLAVAVPAPDASGNSPASIPIYIDGENAGSLFATVGKHNASVSFQKPLVINERGVYAGGATFNEFEIALSRISIFNFDISAESAPYTVADYAGGKPIPPKLLDPSAQKRAVLALEDSLNGAQVRDKSGGANHAAAIGDVAADFRANPATCSFRIGWTSGQSNGVYCGGSDSAQVLPANSLCKILAKSDAQIPSLKVGSASSAAQFSESFSVSQTGWSELDITTGNSASALFITPSAAVAAGANLNVILEIRSIN